MRFIKLSCLFLIVFSGLLMSCSARYEQAYQFNYTFDKDQEGWIAGFADLPADYDPDSFALDSGWSELPPGLQGGAIYLSGHNSSDDLFMFIQEHITGLKPETTYRVSFSINLASNTPAGMIRHDGDWRFTRGECLYQSGCGEFRA